MTAVLLLPHDAPEDEWLARRRKGVTASEVSAILGFSPWQSAFGLHWQKRMGWESEPNEEMSVGTFLEPTIASWFEEFGDPNGNLHIERAGLYANSERPWQMATPDRLIQVIDDCGGECDEGLVANPDSTFFIEGYEPCRACGYWKTVALLECKWVAASWDGWGEEGTDQVPVHYRAQCLWQLDVMGVDEVFLCVLGPGGFRVYRIHRDEKDLRLMRAKARRFLDALDAQEAPDVDGHAATTRALKLLHPTVEDVDIEVTVEFAEGYRRAREMARRAADLVDRYDARARVLLGNGRRLMVGKRLVVSRSVYDQSGDSAELTALDGEWPTTDRLNPGRAKTYAC